MRKKTKRRRTLRQFVKAEGGKSKAAAAARVPRMTLYRWLEGKASPSPALRERLEKEFNVKV